MKEPGSANLGDQLRGLRMQGRFAEAREMIRSQPGFADSAPLQRLLHEHEDFWWAPIAGKRVTLRRRGPQDADFVRACWSDADFMRKFNRLARPLPIEDERLKQLLAREHAGLFGEARALHWTVLTAAGPVGFISATEYSASHRRCEFLIGMLAPAGAGISASRPAAEAARLAVDFLHEKAGVERLTAYFYAENRYAAQVAQKFGFQPEGVLKGYIRDPDGGRSDLLVAGLLIGHATA